MTEQDVIDLGFKLVKKYDHDEFHTKRYSKGIMEVEFTYESGVLVNWDLTMAELNCIPITLEQLKSLTEIFTHP